MRVLSVGRRRRRRGRGRRGRDHFYDRGDRSPHPLFSLPLFLWILSTWSSSSTSSTTTVAAWAWGVARARKNGGDDPFRSTAGTRPRPFLGFSSPTTRFLGREEERRVPPPFQKSRRRSVGAACLKSAGSSSGDVGGDGKNGGDDGVGDDAREKTGAAPPREPRKLTLYNSKSRSKETFRPVSPCGRRVSMYTCGPTVYDYAHVGNFRAFLTYDLVKRVLSYLGYDVEHVCNLTDVDDKIIHRANERGLDDVTTLTREYERHFMDDLRALNIVPASRYPRATEHVADMMEMILLLARGGLAYRTGDGSWYFDTQKQEGYGKQLVELNYDDMEPQSDRNVGDEEDGKRHFADFSLWKAYKEGVDRMDASWSSDDYRDELSGLLSSDDDHPDIPLGRPGWHLECSAMIRNIFGDSTIDLHGGGVDLKFPHHENEIAQSEGVMSCVRDNESDNNNRDDDVKDDCCPSTTTFCNYWFHNGFVNIDDEKMSKSLGNFLTLRGACPTPLDVRAYRYLVVTSQYRGPLSFTPGAMDAARNAVRRIDRIRERLHKEIEKEKEKRGEDADDDDIIKDDDGDGGVLATEIVPEAMKNFEMAVADDLSMPRAAASLFSLVKGAERELKKREAAKNDAEDAGASGLESVLNAMNEMDRVFGIFYDVPVVDGGGGDDDDDNDDDAVPSEVLDLVTKRAAAKDARDYELADSLRSRIAQLGFTVKDVKGGGEPIVCRSES